MLLHCPTWQDVYKRQASMQKDMAKGHESEVQGLLFDMITAAEEQGIDVPTYREVAKKFRS